MITTFYSKYGTWDSVEEFEGCVFPKWDDNIECAVLASKNKQDGEMVTIEDKNKHQFPLRLRYCERYSGREKWRWKEEDEQEVNSPEEFEAYFESMSNNVCNAIDKVQDRIAFQFKGDRSNSREVVKAVVNYFGRTFSEMKKVIGSNVFNGNDEKTAMYNAIYRQNKNNGEDYDETNYL